MLPSPPVRCLRSTSDKCGVAATTAKLAETVLTLTEAVFLSTAESALLFFAIASAATAGANCPQRSRDRKQNSHLNFHSCTPANDREGNSSLLVQLVHEPTPLWYACDCQRGWSHAKATTSPPRLEQYRSGNDSLERHGLFLIIFSPSKPFATLLPIAGISCGAVENRLKFHFTPHAFTFHSHLASAASARALVLFIWRCRIK